MTKERYPGLRLRRKGPSVVSFGTGLSVRTGTSASRIVFKNHPFSTTPPPKSGHPARQEGDVRLSVQKQPQEEGRHVDQGRGHLDAGVVLVVGHASASPLILSIILRYSAECVEGVSSAVRRSKKFSEVRTRYLIPILCNTGSECTASM